MFAIPWHGHTVVGTTDTPVATAELEPVAMEQEVEFILQTASLYLAHKPERSDVLSVFAGIRPLVREGGTGNTAALSRGHTIRVEPGGMVTICGGKWTTYRRMAEDCVNQAAALGGLPAAACVTASLRIQPPERGDELRRAVREEMAETVEDVLARRTRTLFLNAREALGQAPAVARRMAAELGRDAEWEARQVAAFRNVAEGYLLTP
jgi:glycerol-3-phosphate dehydrogenase